MENTTASSAALFVTLGAILLVAPGIEALARRTRLPRVTLFLVLGVFLGPLALDALPAERTTWYPVVAELALAMVGFLLGGEFTRANLRDRGRDVIVVSLAVSVVTGLVVGVGLWAAGAPVALALILGTAATATDPAAVDSVARERNAAGPNVSLLRGVVAVDDVWGLMIFAVVLSVVETIESTDATAQAALMVNAAAELAGSVALGGVLGLMMAELTGRLRPGEPTRLEALGFVLLCCGAASYFELSYLLAAVAMGTVVSNRAKHHEIAFRELEAIEAPFLITFFVLSGATATFSAGGPILVLVAGYVVLRVLGRWLGVRLGLLAARGRFDGRLGMALLPQAGVALGMTLVACEQRPELAPTVLPTVVLGTIFFESVGPVLTARFLDRVGESAPADGSE